MLPESGSQVAPMQQAAANETSRGTGCMCSGERKAFYTDELNSGTSFVFWSFLLLSLLSSLSARWILQGFGPLADPMSSASHPVISLKSSVCACHCWPWSTAEAWSDSKAANPSAGSLWRSPLLDIDCPPPKYQGSNWSWTRVNRGCEWGSLTSMS